MIPIPRGNLISVAGWLGGWLAGIISRSTVEDRDRQNTLKWEKRESWVRSISFEALRTVRASNVIATRTPWILEDGLETLQHCIHLRNHSVGRRSCNQAASILKFPYSKRSAHQSVAVAVQNLSLRLPSSRTTCIGDVGSHLNRLSSTEQADGESGGERPECAETRTDIKRYQFASGRGGQCLVPLGYLRLGEPDPMSQREPASRSASPRISRSPPTGTSTSPSSHQSDSRRAGNQPASSGGQLESGGIPRTNGDLTQSVPQRGFGVRNILNPAETQLSPTRTPTSVSGPPGGRPLHPSPGQQGPAFESTPSTPRPFLFPGRGMTSQQQANPAASGQFPLGPPLTDRDSPASTHSHPGFGAARRILTPRSPRVGGTGHAPPPRVLNAPQSHYYPAAPSAPNRGFPADLPAPGQHVQSPQISGPQPLAPHFGRIHTPGVGPPTTLAPLSALPPRSLSQPIPSQFNTPGQESHHSRTSSGSQPSPHAFGSTPPYSTGVPPSNRVSFPPSLPVGDSRWAGGLGGAVQAGPGVRGMMGVDGHAAMNVGGEPLIVPLDMYNGSKQADEKRQRNAGASARFRARKKDKEIQQGLRIQELESQNRELLKRQQEAESERDRYRSDRDRLRDIVYRTPGISELAYQGPPSPISTRSAGSFPERSPLAPNPTPLPMPTYGAADPVTGERATRRRRTDPQLEYSPSYAAQTGLPSIPQPIHTPLSQPGTPSAAGRTSRLPPLRLDQPAGTPTTGPSTTSTPVQSFPPYKREPYETGWATRPSAPHDPSQR
ncbi:hypothetical protein AAE478_003075 [Parahypoxylon ruwenzoriense]